MNYLMGSGNHKNNSLSPCNTNACACTHVEEDKSRSVRPSHELVNLLLEESLALGDLAN